MTRQPRPQVLDAEASKLVERGYILESSEFRNWAQQQKIEAQRTKDDLMAEVDRFETEIQARMIRVSDLDEIIARADAALTLDVPRTRPQLTPAVNAIQQSTEDGA